MPKNKEQKQSRQSILYFLPAKAYPAKFPESWKKYIWETYICKWFIVSREAYLHLQCMSFLMNI